jgi:thiol-disulfide isomerase/thioredoxin
MKKVVAGLSLACAVAVLVAASPKGEPTYPTYVKEKTLYAKKDFRGLKAPKFVVETWLAGGDPKTKGKVVVIDFWATWCPPCRALIPEMNGWAKKFAKDVVFIGVSNEPTETVKKFMGDTKMEYSVAIDTKKRMSEELGVQGIPHVMIISADGIVRWQGFPGSQEDPLTAEKIQQIVEASKAGVK